jgi:hypothetical protein
MIRSRKIGDQKIEAFLEAVITDCWTKIPAIFLYEHQRWVKGRREKSRDSQ